MKVKLTAGEMMEVLDDLHKDAYDKLQGALERKVLEVLAEKKWVEIWDTGNWSIELTLEFNTPKELL